MTQQQTERGFFRLGPIAALLASLVLPGSAAAQALYVVGAPTVGTAPTYTGWTSINMLDDLTNPSFGRNATHGAAELNLPFSFVFFGKSYTKLTVLTHGAIIFENGTPPVCRGGFSNGDCYAPNPIPSAKAPNALLAFWWGHMHLSEDTTGTSTTGKYTRSGAVGSQIFSIRFDDWAAYGLTEVAYRNVQIDLYEKSGAIRVYYGAITPASSNADNATAGVENATASLGLNLLPCTANSSTHCTQSDWPAGKYVEVLPSDDPDLLVTDVTGSALTPATVNGKPGFSLDVSASIKNQGKNAATGFIYDLYLSTDATIDASDKKIGSHVTPETLQGFSTAVYTDTQVQFEKPAGSGNFYIGVLVDPPSAALPKGNILESIETNNSGASTPYVLGAELTGDISGPTNSGPGDPADLHVIVKNRGTDPTGTFSYEVWLSSNTSYDPLVDKKMHTGTLSLLAGETFDQTVTATVPGIPDGSYFYIIVVDPPTPGKPGGAVVEANENNNITASSGKVTTSAADLKVENIKVISPLPSSAPTTKAFFGEKIRVQFLLTNMGGSSAKNFDISLLLSDNAVITLHDTDMSPPGAGLTNLTYLGGESKQFDVELTVPTKDDSGKALADGDYYFGVIVDSSSKVPESNESNNIARALDAIRIRQPAMDLTVARIDAPSVGAVGEVMPVFRTLRNQGNRGNLIGGAAFEYRYYLSSNDIISPEDIPLGLVVGGVARTIGEGRLDAFSDDRGTDLVKLPPDLSPGTYYIGLIVDPDGKLPELDEKNNTGSSVGTVEIVSSSLRVETTYLPDAVVGVGYLQQLGASGGASAYSWQLEPNQGGLPNGLALSTDGVLSGTPSECVGSGCAVPGNAVFTVRVTSADRVALARLVLRSVVSSGALSVLSTTLPTAIRGTDYAAGIAAVGGVRPYLFTLEDGALPDGLTLSPQGKIAGRVGKAYPDPLLFKILVTDAFGNQRRGALSLRSVEPGTLVVTTSKLGDGFVGIPYTQQLQAVGGKPPLIWKLTRGALPDGLRLAGAAITGVASKAGLTAVALTVTDSAGGSDSAEFLLTLLPRPANFHMPLVPEAKRGDPYSLDLAGGALVGTLFALSSGELPPGLTIDRRGSISGVVAADAPTRAYNALLLITEQSGASTLAPLAIVVVAPDKAAEAAPRTGCSSAAGSVLPLATLAAFILPFTRRRRRAARV